MSRPSRRPAAKRILDRKIRAAVARADRAMAGADRLILESQLVRLRNRSSIRADTRRGPFLIGHYPLVTVRNPAGVELDRHQLGWRFRMHNAWLDAAAHATDLARERGAQIRQLEASLAEIHA
jgi:hypothetical protein